MMADFAGYTHPKYALSLQEFGDLRKLPRCGGWILVRPIPDTPYKDGMGCYPFFTCRDWYKLHEDMNGIKSELLSLSLVTDPFGEFDQAYLGKCFQVVRPFKHHLIADLSQKPDDFVKKHHRYYARRSLREMHVEICDEPVQYAEEWAKLYDNLIKRHKISGIRAFSKDSFRAQMQIPGVIIVVGKLGKEVIGGQLIVIQNNVAYSHLAAFSDDGYKYNASYGIYWVTIEYLAGLNIRYFDLGASPGLEDNAQNGLAKFKAGWSNASRIVFLCGLVFDRQKYANICQQKNVGNTVFFPAYREGESY